MYKVEQSGDELPVQRAVAVVTGASRGFGLALAQALHEAGSLVIGAARSPLPAVRVDPFALYSCVDVRDEQSVQVLADEATRRFGRIDVWINNAAVVDIFDIASGSSQRWRELWETNVLGVVHGTQAFTRHVRFRPGPGILVNVTAGSARGARGQWGAYAATKAAVERLTEAVAAEEEVAGLRAFCFSPGAMDTAMQEYLRSLPEDRFPDAAHFRARADRGELSATRAVADRLVREIAIAEP